MTVMDNEDPALPDDIDEAEAVIACLGDDAAKLREANAECEIAANMEAAATMLEKLRATEIGAREAYGVIVEGNRSLKEECAHLRELLSSAHEQIRRLARGA